MKFSSGGAHISRTMMLAELSAVLANVPQGSSAADYREAILERNVLSKTTDSTRRESLRRLRELGVSIAVGLHRSCNCPAGSHSSEKRRKTTLIT